MDQAALDAHLAERRLVVAAKGASRLRELSGHGGDELEAELHRLAGTLGTFGLPDHSTLARRLLIGLRDGTLAGPALNAAVAGLIGDLEEVS